MEALELANAGWLSILPPLIAIILALLTKEVISSLIVGIVTGAFIYSGGNVILTIENTFRIMAERMGEENNVNILIFLGLLGTIVILVTKAGGASAYGNWAANKIKTRKGASLATSALGAIIFIDDYFNCLTVGTVMRPVTDKHRISRAKLAYLLDAMAAPICIIAPISSWGASIASYMEDATHQNGMTIFIQTIPYNLYALLTIIMVFIVCSTRLNFGPMKAFEKKAIEQGDISSEVSKELDDSIVVSEHGKVYDLIIPILSLICFTIVAMIYTGGGFSGEVSPMEAFGSCNASLSLVMGSFLALIVTFFLYLPRKIITFEDFTGSVSEGIKSMVPAFTFLILAWTIGGICSEAYLNTGGFIGNLVKESNFPMFILPVIIFFVAAFLGFATGTSWGTMAILVPVGASISSADATGSLLIPVMGAVLAGAVFGDHISPISDTTILSSTGAGCNHIDHVSTQLVYATVVAVCCAIGYLLMGITTHYLIPLVVSIVCLLVILWVIYVISNKKDPIDFGDRK